MAEMLTKWLNQSQNSVSEESYIALLSQLITAGLEDWGNSTPIYQILVGLTHYKLGVFANTDDRTLFSKASGFDISSFYEV